MRTLIFLLLLFVIYISCEESKDENVIIDDISLLLSGECRNKPDYWGGTTYRIDSVTVIEGWDGYGKEPNVYLEGEGVVNFESDSTYSIIYNYRFNNVRKPEDAKIGINVFEKNETGKFSYNYELDLGYRCTNTTDPNCLTEVKPTTGEGVIIFRPHSGGTWSAHFIYRPKYGFCILEIIYEYGTLRLPICRCIIVE